MNKVKELLDQLKDNNVGIRLGDNNKLRLIYDQDEQLPENLINKIKDFKEDIKEYLNSYLKSTTFEIPRIDFDKSYSLSSSQRRLWVLSQFEEGSVAYNTASHMALNGDYDIVNFKNAVYSVIGRHEILRTAFRADESGEIRQWILPEDKLDFKIHYKDFRRNENIEDNVRKYIHKDYYTKFDLEKAPLFRASLLQTSDYEYVFCFSMHHIISDGWSKEVLLKDLMTYYEAYKGNRIPYLPELRIQYKDYAAWQKKQLEGISFQQHRDYWLNNLSGDIPLLNLPTQKLRPQIMTSNGYSLSTYISSDVIKRLKLYCQNQGGSLFMGLLATCNILLYKYTSQSDIILGAPVSGREHADLENQIGFYINTLVLKNHVDPEDSFYEFYNKVKKSVLDAYEHQEYPFDELVEDLNLKRDISRSAVFDVMLTLQNVGEIGETFELDEKSISEIIDNGSCASKCDMDITFEEVGEYLSFNISYNTDVYEREMVEGLMKHFGQLLSEILDSPEFKIGLIDYITEEERNQLLYTFNDTEVDISKNRTVVDLFEEQVSKNPDKIAVIFENERYTYLEIDILSNKLASFISSKSSIHKEDLIGVKIDRNEWLLISVLAIFKLGGAYIPIDPTYPKDRIEYILNNSKCEFLIDSEVISSFMTLKNSTSLKFERKQLTGSDLAYVIYTSGSTGKPKATMIEHGGMLNHLYAMEKELHLDNHSVIVQNASCTFDVSVWQLLNALITGGATSIYDQSIVLEPDRFLSRLALEQVSILQVVPSYLKILLDIEDSSSIKRLNSLSYLLVTGETVSKQLICRWFEAYPDIKVVNAYGPAEASDDVTLHIMSQPPDGFNVSIGKPIQNICIHVLDDYLQLCPIGVVGEIYVSGIGVGRGYLYDELKTSNSYFKDPFFDKSRRMYRTGDLGSWSSDGLLEFLGRRDNQIKIRGHRIELGEIENELLGLDAIEECVVVSNCTETDEKFLIGYYVGKEALEKRQIRNELSHRLPDYMIPDYYVKLNKFSLTPNGKIDRKALPNPLDLGISNNTKYEAPSNEIEKELVKIWEEILNKEKIGVYDNFFELGGHSLSIIKINVMINKKFNTILPMTTIFDYSSISELSKYIQYNMIEINNEGADFELIDI